MKHITMNLLDYFWKTGIKPVREAVENLHKVASTGKYIDLEGRPTIPTALKNPQALTFTGGVTGSYDGSAAKSVKIPSLTNNLLATAAGTALDAAQGKVLDGKIAQINSNLSKKKIAFTFAAGITHQAGDSYVIGNVAYISECISITKDIPADTKIITSMKISGTVINCCFTYGNIIQNFNYTGCRCIVTGSSITTEKLIEVGDGSYPSIIATCVLNI